MSDQPPSKRTYSQHKEDQSQASEQEPPSSTKYLASTNTGRQTMSRIEDTMVPESRAKVQQTIFGERPSSNADDTADSRREDIINKKKSNHKHKDRDRQQTLEKKNKLKKKKKHKNEKQHEPVKQQQADKRQQTIEKHKKKHKKKSKEHKDTNPNVKAEENPGIMPQIAQEQKIKKKKHKSKSKTKATEPDQENKQKNKSRESPPEKRGRKSTTPVKKKRPSIHEQQQIINKKYRVKKKSGFLNAQSRRTWGQFRAGPYRKQVKVSKEEQRRVIQQLCGNGPYYQEPVPQDIPDDQQQGQQADWQEVKIEGDIVPQSKPSTEPEASVKQEEEHFPEKSLKKRKKNIQFAQDEEKASKSKHKSSKKSKKKKKSDEEKQQPQEKHSKPKKKKKKKKQSEAGTDVKQEDDETAVKKQFQSEETKQATEAETKKKTLKKKRKREQSNSSNDSSKSSTKERKIKRKRRLIKKQHKPKMRSKKQELNEFTREESQKIIDLFAIDGGNYPEMMKELPGFPLKKVRSHLRMLFHRALDIITYQVQNVCGRKIKEWEHDQRIEIVRELHRIRSSNRLLAENQVHFRQNMTYLMRSYNDESFLEKVKPQAIQALYRRLQSFVRGYNTINRSKRTSAASITESKNKEKQQRYKFSKQVTRKPIICGGHLLSRTTVKKEQKQEPDQMDLQQKIRGMASPENVVDQWNRQQEKALCQLYLANRQEADEVICDQLKERFGVSIKWRDFEVLERKLNQLVRMALIKLQNLTSKPYCQVDRQKAKEKKQLKMFQNIKKQFSSAQEFTEYYFNKRRMTSMFLYDNDIFKKEERVEFKHRIFKNLSLFERQVFGHLESYRLKGRLIKILIEEFPPEKDIQDAVNEAKNFSKWARENEREDQVHSIKHVLIGDRIIHDADNSDEDSIMADITKVPIIKPPGLEGDYSQTTSMNMSQSMAYEKKAEGLGMSKVGDETVPIDLDDQDLIDFEQPGKEEDLKQNDSGLESDYSRLTKIYTTLNSSRLQ